MKKVNKSLIFCFLVLCNLLLLIIPSGCFDDEKTSDNIFYQLSIAHLDVTVTPDDAGSVNVIVKEGEAGDKPTYYRAGAKLELTAVPKEGWEFAYWSGNVSGKENPISFIIYTSKNIVAHFVKTASFKVSASPPEGGTVSPVSKEPDGTIKCHIGDKVTLTALPNKGYVFSHWEGRIESIMSDISGFSSKPITMTDNPAVVTINDDNWVFTAVFKPIVETPEEIPLIPTIININPTSTTPTTTTPTTTTPQTPQNPTVPPEQAISAALTASVRTEGYAPDCQFFITISFEGKDLTGKTPITHVVLTVNNVVWHDSGNISTKDYQNVVQKEVASGRPYDLSLTVTNINGQSVTAIKEIILPACPEPVAEAVLKCEFSAAITCQSSGGICTCTIKIIYDAIDLTGGQRPVTNVILKVNGEVWADSGKISVVRYDNTVTRTVSCGGSFFIGIIAVNATGQSVTCSKTLTAPSP